MRKMQRATHQNSSVLSPTNDSEPFPSRHGRDSAFGPQFSYSQYRGLYAYRESQPNSTRQSFCYDATFEYVTQNTNFKDAQTICDGLSPCLPRYGMFLQQQASLPDYWGRERQIEKARRRT
ncbi:MAG: hypothetical protein ACREDC_11275 [Bradyrhizobium sp.]